MQWHYTNKGQQFGPVDYAELCRLAQQGEITPDDLVWSPTFGDNKWVPASSVENIFVESPEMYRNSGSTHNRDLMRLARESLSNHWGLGVVVMLLYLIFTTGVSELSSLSKLAELSEFIPLVGSLVCMIISGPMAVGFYLVFLSIARRSETDVSKLFYGFSRFWTALGANFFMSMFIFLWTLLLIIPGIIATYAYSMTYFIIADDPSVKASEAIRRSKEMMRGNKWKLFYLYWRFFGWALLCILTLGIGFLWLGPYVQTSLAHFYYDVKRGSRWTE